MKEFSIPAMPMDLVVLSLHRRTYFTSLLSPSSFEIFSINCLIFWILEKWTKINMKVH
jgi:hypothetical protein